MTESTLDPMDFNVEDWLTDAHLPEESAVVYKRADVVAELTDLKRRIAIADRVAVAEPSAAEEALTPLEQEYAALLQTFSDSALTVYVQAITEEKLRAMRELHDERTKDMLPKDANNEFGYDILAASIVAVKPAGQERQRVVFTPARVKKLRDSIGDTQVKLILEARQTAQNQVPAVDADFLLKPSGEGDGRE